MAILGTQFQPWFDEGFAEFFSTIKITRKKQRSAYRRRAMFES